MRTTTSSSTTWGERLPTTRADAYHCSEELTQLIGSLRGVVFDFDGVFTENRVLVDQNGTESVLCWRSDGLGLARLRDLGIKILIVSTELNPIVSVRAKKLMTQCIQGAGDKATVVAEWASSLGIALSQIAFVGNDINDIPAFKKVGLPIGVADSYDEITPFIRFRTNRPGGYGAVREVCDLIVKVRSDSPGDKRSD